MDVVLSVPVAKDGAWRLVLGLASLVELDVPPALAKFVDVISDLAKVFG